jgi:hypothetical protein
MFLEDVPDWVAKELKKADDGQTKELFNVAIQVAASAQQKLQLRQMIFDLQTNGDVLVSTVMDAEGKSAVPYARIHRDGKITVHGKMNFPKTDYP